MNLGLEEAQALSATIQLFRIQMIWEMSKKKENVLDSNMSKSIFFLVSSMVSFKLVVRFGTVVVGQFQSDTFHVPQIIMSGLGTRSKSVRYSFGKSRQEI